MTESDKAFFARSETTQPEGQLLWTLRVSDQLVQEASDGWSQLVQFRFEKLDDGRLEMWMRIPPPVPRAKAVKAAYVALRGVDPPLLDRTVERVVDAVLAALAAGVDVPWSEGAT